MKFSQKALSLITIALLLLSGVELSYAMMAILIETQYIGEIVIPLGGNSNVNWYIATTIISSVVLGAMAYLVHSVQDKEEQAARLVEWTGIVQDALLGVRYPLSRENLQPVGEKLVALFPRNKGWMMVVLSPGLLMKGEMMRRKYIKIRSKEFDSVWAESALMEKLEDPQLTSFGREVSCAEKDFERGLEWVYKSSGGISGGDLSVGIFIALPQSPGIERSALFTTSMDSVLSLFVRQLGVLLVDILDRKENANGEYFALVVKGVVHELAGDLQRITSRSVNDHLALTEYMKDIGVQPTDPFAKEYRWRANRLNAGLMDSAQMIDLIRSIPYLQQNRLGVDKTQKVEFGEMISAVIGDISQMFPTVSITSKGLFAKTKEEKIYLQAGTGVRNIFVNTIKNAASFSPEFGEVVVQCSLKNGQLKVVVTDEGPGVSRDDVDHIFDLSSKSKPRADGQRGMGVGLTICRMIARSYGGDIKCIPNTKVHGGRFEILLPIARIGEEEV